MIVELQYKSEANSCFSSQIMEIIRNLIRFHINSTKQQKSRFQIRMMIGIIYMLKNMF